MLPHVHPLFAVSTWVRLRRLGGPGLVLLGIADQLPVPSPAAWTSLPFGWLRHREPWFYYALMATIGAMVGGYITYALAHKGGKETMERKLSKKRAQKIQERFERWGFWAIAVPALLPPPFPFVPFLIAAGAMQYSRKKFLGALLFGRGLRYSIAAYLGSLYGRQVLRFFSRYQKPALSILIGLAVVGGILSLIEYIRYSIGRRPNSAVAQPEAAFNLEQPACLR